MPSDADADEDSQPPPFDDSAALLRIIERITPDAGCRRC